MLQTWTYTLISVSIVSLIGLIGALFLTIRDNLFRKLVLYLVSFSTGALFGDTFIHIIPEVAHKYGLGIKASASILAGIVAFFVLEKFVYWQHCHSNTIEGHVCTESHVHPVAYINLVGDSVHNFIDGMIIAGSFAVDKTLGFATTLAVILHEIPTEMGHYSIYVYAGFSKKKALGFNFLSAMTAILGGVVTLVAYKHFANIASLLLPFTAGGFIYLAGSDLIPELQKEIRIHRSLLQLVMMLMGIGLMFLLLWF